MHKSLNFFSIPIEHKLLLGFAFLVLMPLSPAYAYDSYWPFRPPSNRLTLLEKALGPYERAVTFVINGRPHTFETPKELDLPNIELGSDELFVLIDRLHRLPTRLEKIEWKAKTTISQQRSLTGGDTTPIVIYSRTIPVRKLEKVIQVLQPLVSPNLTYKVTGDILDVYYTPVALPGRDPVQFANLLDSAAILAFKNKEFAEAEQLLLESLQLKIQLYGPDHRQVAIHEDHLAQLYRATNQFDKAINYLQDSLRIAQLEQPLNRREISAAHVRLVFTYDDNHERTCKGCESQQHPTVLQSERLRKAEELARLINNDQGFVSARDFTNCTPSPGPRPLF